MGGGPPSLWQLSKRLSQPTRHLACSPAYSPRVIKMAVRAEDTIPLHTPQEHPQATAIKKKKVIFAMCDICSICA